MNDAIFERFFRDYEGLSLSADRAFASVAGKYPECVKCKPICSDCCYATFDLTLIEALYINHRFNMKFNQNPPEALLEKCNKVDRELYKIKKRAYKSMESGKEEKDIIFEMAELRIRCPMLNEDDMCDIYEFRPVTCRLYGIPTAIDGKGYTCGLSGFQKGVTYPTANIDQIHNRLLQLSAELAAAVGSKYTRMGEMLVPLSMALTTTYDDNYLGISEDDALAKKSDT